MRKFLIDSCSKLADNRGNLGNGDITSDGYHKYKVPLSLLCR